MEIQIIDHKSKWLGKVQDLGDTASSTVGFLPRDAYTDYARRNQILVVTEGNELLGYTMYRETAKIHDLNKLHLIFTIFFCLLKK